MHVVERYTRINRDAILYDATVEDPKVFTKPWLIHSSMMLRTGTRVREYECDDNIDIQHRGNLENDDSLFKRKTQ